MNENAYEPLSDAGPAAEVDTVSGTAAPSIRSDSSALTADEVARLTDDIVSAIKTVYDPEIPADIYELGLIYRIEIGDDRKIDIDMT
jgi:hypothetical protein